MTDDPFVINLALGGIAGAISNVLIFPADLVKTKMQSAKTDQSKNAWETAQAVVATEGFSGAVPAITLKWISGFHLSCLLPASQARQRSS